MPKKSFADSTDNVVTNNVLNGSEFDTLDLLFGQTSTRTVAENRSPDIEETGEATPKKVRSDDLGDTVNITESKVQAWEKAFQKGASDDEAESRAAVEGGGGGNDNTGTYTINQEQQGDKDQRRRDLAAKWSGRILNNFQASGFVIAYDRLLGPSEDISLRHKELRDLVVVGSATENQKAEFVRLDDQLRGFDTRKRDYESQSKMPPADEAELHECLLDIFAQEDLRLSPAQVVMMVMGGQIFTNLAILMKDWMAHGKVGK